MSLQKAKIVILSSNTEIPVMYNPPEYTVATNATVEGSGANVKFTKVEKADFTVDLFFDTYEAGSDVRDKTKDVVKLLNPTESGKQVKNPPEVLFAWGNFTFKGIVTKVSQKFSMFLGDGTPVRCNLNVTLKAVNTPEQEVQNTGDDACRKVYAIAEKDRLDLIASKTLKDPALWRDIVTENTGVIIHPREFPERNHVGEIIFIPDVYEARK